MFESVIQSRLNSLSKITYELNDYSPETIENSSLPAFIKNFLLIEINNAVNEKEFFKLLEKSVRLQLNYSLRPKWTLSNYLFGNVDSKPTEDILDKAAVFNFYRYYPELISNYIRENVLHFITQKRVVELIEETDSVLYEKLTKDLTSIKVKNFFMQVFRLKYGEDKDITLEHSIPFVFIKLFLEDKGFKDILNKFKMLNLNDSSELDMKTVIKVMTDKLSVSDSFQVKQDKEKEVLTEVQVIKSQVLPTPVTEKEDKIEILVNEEKIKKEPEEQKHEAINEKEFEKEVKEIIPDKVVERPLFGDRQRIKTIFKSDELTAIVKRVYKSSRQEMSGSFEELEKIASWEPAMEYLKELFKKNKVDIYNKHVVLFVDLLEDYFKNKEEV